MTAYRNRTPDAEAAQYLPTSEEPLKFSDRPAWLEQELEHNRITVRRDPSGSPYLSVQGTRGVHLAAPTDWVVRDRWDHIDVIPADRFAADFDLFEAPAEPVTAAATGSQEPAETAGASK